MSLAIAEQPTAWLYLCARCGRVHRTRSAIGQAHREPDTQTPVKSVDDRLWPKVDRSGGPEACWPWLGAINQGYGYFWLNGTMHNAHRVVYELLIGPVPDGLTLDHLCQNTRCVNPAHLDPCPTGENTLRSSRAITAINARKTHCVRGHEFTPENTRILTGRKRGRQCIECAKAKGRHDGE